MTSAICYHCGNEITASRDMIVAHKACIGDETQLTLKEMILINKYFDNQYVHYEDVELAKALNRLDTLVKGFKS